MALRVSQGVRILPGVGAPYGIRYGGVAAVGYPFEQQAASNWCWAACAAMVRRARGKPRAQCRIVLDLVPGAGPCCTSPGSDACNVPATRAQLENTFESISPMLDDQHPAGATWLRHCLVQGAVAVLWEWRDRSLGVRQHVVLVVGSRQGDEATVFRVHDPKRTSDEEMSYAELESARGRGQWILAWVNL